MTQAVIQKEYRKLLGERARIEKIIRVLLAKLEPKSFGKDLLYLSKLGIRGGPKDLAARFDFYLYH